MMSIYCLENDTAITTKNNIILKFLFFRLVVALNKPKYIAKLCLLFFFYHPKHTLRITALRSVLLCYISRTCFVRRFSAVLNYR
jgi:hypothetical protein